MLRLVLLVFLTVSLYEPYAQSCFGPLITAESSCYPTSINPALPAYRLQWKKNGTVVQTVEASWKLDAFNAVEDPNNNGINDVFVSTKGHIYVAEQFGYRVVRYTSSRTNGVVVAGGNGPGAGLNQLQERTRIFVDANDNVYVSDQQNHRVVRWAPGASTGVRVAGGITGGSTTSLLNNPEGIFVDASGNIYIADRMNHRVIRWLAGAASGTRVAGGNGEGAAANQLSYPAGVWVVGANIYVANQGNARIQKWVSGATTGTTVDYANSFFLRSVFADAMNNVFYLDQQEVKRVLAGTASVPSMSIGTVIARANASSSNALGLGFGPDGSIYVGDNTVRRVQKFHVTIQSYIASTAGTYTATVTTIDNCVATSSEVTIIDAPNPSIKLSTVKTTLCAKEPFLIKATVENSGTSPWYQWTNDNEWVYINTPDYTVEDMDKSALVHCRITNNQTGCSAADELYINIKPLPLIDTISSSGNCVPATLGYTSTPGLAFLTWENNGIAAGHNNIPWQTSSTPYVSNNFNGRDNPLSSTDWAPLDIKVDAQGNTYVLDSLFPRVLKFAPGAMHFTTVAGTTFPGNTATRLDGPTSIALDSAGNLYVADKWNNRVQKFAPGSITAVTFTYGNRPQGLFIHNGFLYASYSANHVVSKMPLNATLPVASLITVAGGNGSGPAANQLNSPGAIYVDGTDNVYVADGGNFRVQLWPAGSTTGTTVAGGNGPGTADNQLTNMDNIFVAGGKNVFLGMRGFLRLWESEQGKAEIVFAGTRPFLDGEGVLYLRSGFQVRRFNFGKSLQFTAGMAGSMRAKITGLNGCPVYTNVIPLGAGPAPSFTVLPGQNPICEETPVSFSLSFEQAAASPIYQWIKNGAPVSTAAEFTDNAMRTTDKLSCIVMDAANNCRQEMSPSLVVKPKPIIALTNSSNTLPATLTLNSNGVLPSILWRHNNTPFDTTHNWKEHAQTVASMNDPSGIFVHKEGFFYTAGSSAIYQSNIKAPTVKHTIMTGSDVRDVWRADDSLFVLSGHMVNSFGLGGVFGNLVAGRPSTTGGTTGMRGSADSLLDNPYQLAVAPNRDVYIADHSNSRIQKWEKGARSGTTVAGVTGLGYQDPSDPRYLGSPIGVSVDDSQHVFVTEGYGQVHRWDKSATRRTTLATYDLYTYGHFRAPNGDLYLSAFKMGGEGSVVRLAEGTNQLMAIAGNKGVGNNANQLNSPQDVGLDEVGNLFVADSRNNRVQLFTADSAKTKVVEKAGLYHIAATGYNGCMSTDSVVVFAGTFTFTGNSDWSNSSNWENNITPPSAIPYGYLVVIDPASGECIINGDLKISKNAVLKVAPGKKFTITGHLILE